jgi:4-hydroxybenzoate decarboxylase subunit C
MHDNLRSLIETLRRENNLVEINAEVDSYLEIAEIHRRVISEGGPALLFNRVKNSPYPVVTNLFGTKRRIDLAFGARPENFVRQAVKMVEALLPPKPAELWNFRSTVFDLLKLGTKKKAGGPVMEVRETEPNLESLPLLQLWPDDGGHFITLPLVYTESPGEGKHNLGMYRIQRYDKQTTGIHWQIHKGGGFHYAEAEARGESLPVTIFLGGPPALILAAIAPLPEGVPELVLASVLSGKKISTVSNPHGGHRLIAEAEFAICGSVAPRERRPEGPFGDHYGYYSLEHDYPVFRADAIYHRRDAIFPATVVGKPRQEDFFIGDYLQELLSPLFPLVMPSVRDLWSYGETGFHSLAAAVVKDRYSREAFGSAFRILGEGQLSLTKFLLLTDSPLDLRDFRRLFEHILARADWATDFFIFSNTSLDTLDYTSGKINHGSKAVLLGLGDEKRTLPREFNGTLPAEIRNAEVYCAGCIVVDGPPFTADRNLGSRLAADPAFDKWQIIVLHDSADAAKSDESFLWATWTRFNPATDVYSAKTEIKNNHISYCEPIVIDARTKPWFPSEVEADPETVMLVNNRWREYFPSKTNHV